MSDFEYDCLQKKRIAGQAKYRKRGSKSKKCNLPSDRLTHKQWKDKCGPLMRYNMNEPMSWNDFKQMPVDIQSAYIIGLQEKYGATAVDLGNMFGVRALTVRKHADANKLCVTFPRGHAMSATQKSEWDKFLCNDSVTEELPSVDPDRCDDACVATDESNPDISDANTDMKMNNFSLRFSGPIDVNTVANSLRWMLGEATVGELEIIFNLT